MQTAQNLPQTQMIVRYQHPNNEVYYGVVEGDEIKQLSNDFSEIAQDKLTFDGTRLNYDDVTILEPVVPSKIINFGWTYAAHADETGGEANLKEPFLFLKPTTSLVPNDGDIILPPTDLTNQVELEGELALVIGKRGKNIKEEDAMDYVYGCTIFNDVTARDLTVRDPQFTRAKGFDTFGPLGPCIVKGLDPTNVRIVTTLNGEVVQDGNTNQMSFSMPFLISWISQVMTLEPGDVLATGSPAGSCPMKSGDMVVVEIEHIGKLRNFVK